MPRVTDVLWSQGEDKCLPRCRRLCQTDASFWGRQDPGKEESSGKGTETLGCGVLANIYLSMYKP